MISLSMSSVFFFFNDTATTEIYTLSLHDALPICRRALGAQYPLRPGGERRVLSAVFTDRKSTRLNSSHGYISYAVFCLKKKKIKTRVVLLTYLTILHYHNDTVPTTQQRACHVTRR